MTTTTTTTACSPCNIHPNFQFPYNPDARFGNDVVMDTSDNRIAPLGLNNPNLDGLEFDGDMVLCRICGDKASGFHYGVHACEGCKGFFRRSIQQKIQYRACLKNQQCSVMRANRNRCQYCRLKKCIAVGMSRDAVRFGRVPKKEKAKIMEQMAKVNSGGGGGVGGGHSSTTVAPPSTADTNPTEVLRRVVEIHRETCDFTRANVQRLREMVCRSPQYVDCPAQLACPLNPCPQRSDGIHKWEEYSEYFTPAICNVVNFAKLIPGFQSFSQEDQVTLLKAGTFEVLLVHLACLFHSASNTMLFTNGLLYKRKEATVTSSAGFLLNSMFDFAERINELELTDEEIALFSAVIIIAPDRVGLRKSHQVAAQQNVIMQALKQLLASHRPHESAIFDKLIAKIPDLRTLNTLHSEKLLGLSVSPLKSGTDASVTSSSVQSCTSDPVASDASKLSSPAVKREGAAIMAQRVAMETPSDVVLQTPQGVFRRDSDAAQWRLSESDTRGQQQQQQQQTFRSPLLIQHLEGSKSSAATATSSAVTSAACHPTAVTDTTHLDVPKKRYFTPEINLKLQKFWDYEMRTSRSASLGSSDLESRLQRQWEYDVRSSRSNSMSSNTSAESVDSAYRTISTPGTPRSASGDLRTSPHPADTEDSTLKSALSTPPLVGQHLWFMGEPAQRQQRLSEGSHPELYHMLGGGGGCRKRRLSEDRVDVGDMPRPRSQSLYARPTRTRFDAGGEHETAVMSLKDKILRRIDSHENLRSGEKTTAGAMAPKYSVASSATTAMSPSAMMAPPSTALATTTTTTVHHSSTPTARHSSASNIITHAENNAVVTTAVGSAATADTLAQFAPHMRNALFSLPSAPPPPFYLPYPAASGVPFYAQYNALIGAYSGQQMASLQGSDSQLAAYVTERSLPLNLANKPPLPMSRDVKTESA